ncbi:signal peptide peptidase SppA [bacterium]|nr:MAG: signal peptide peptidase SppA [bacterium]
MTLAEAVFGLKRAAADDRISALVMDMRGLDADWAKIEELQAAVRGFAEAGKPTVAYLDGAFTREYALAAMADQIVMSPEANLMVLGITAELDFLKDILDKLGMRADFIHIGKYKSAPERMTRTEASAANLEMINAIVDDRWDALLGMIAAGRNVDRQRAAAWVDRGLYDGPTALADGLVDTLGYLDDMLDIRFADEDFTNFSDYVLDRKGSGGTSGKVALVYVTGVIMPGESRFDRFQGKIAGSETIVERLRLAGEDESIGAVILRVDSPGGSALASDLIWHAIRQVQQDKPVIASMGGMAASGGYYVSCPADSIFAPAGTLTGSIGVYAGKMDRTAMYGKIGVNREFVTRGDNALLFSDEGGFSKSQREIFTAQMEGFYERFLDKVGDGRGMQRDAVHEVAQGRVWTGRQGLERGLVDEEGGLRRALDAAKWSVGLTPDDRVGVVTYGEQPSFFERILLESMRRNASLASAAGDLAELARGAAFPGLDLAPVPLLTATLREDGTFARMALMDGRPVAMAPYWVRVR